MRARSVTSVVNRYYDPSTDQFMSIDPQVAATNQPYVFANDNPLNLEDADGLMPEQVQRGQDWANGNLQDTIGRYLGSDVGVKGGNKGNGKIIFYDKNDPSKEVVYDTNKNYYRVLRVTKSGSREYYDSANDTWGTNKGLGDEGQANSHYYNTGEQYGSTGEASQQFDLSATGDDVGDGGDGGGLLFMIFPSVSTFCAVSGRCKQGHPLA
jgi:hypothetical protein